MSHEKLRTKKKDKKKKTYEKYGKYNNKYIRINQQKMTSKLTNDNLTCSETNDNVLPKSSNNIDILFDTLFDNIERDGPNKKINDDNWDHDEFQNEWERRRLYIEKYSWAVPSKEAYFEMIRFIDNDRCVETGAGSGLWSHLLQLCGVDIVPTDNKFSDWSTYYTEVEKLDDIDALEKYNDRNVLFLCWSTTDPVSHFAGNKIIYVGEELFGCTSGEPNEDEWELVKRINIPVWVGLHDYLGLYVRKSQLPKKLLMLGGIVSFVSLCGFLAK